MKTFNTQVCTTKEQSKRLLELGLKKETADMVYCVELYENGWEYSSTAYVLDGNLGIDEIPAWSLNRLICLCEHSVTINHKENVITYNMCRDFYGLETIYDNLIDCIEYLINEGFINKEYLEE